MLQQTRNHMRVAQPAVRGNGFKPPRAGGLAHEGPVWCGEMPRAGWGSGSRRRPATGGPHSAEACFTPLQGDRPPAALNPARPHCSCSLHHSSPLPRPAPRSRPGPRSNPPLGSSHELSLIRSELRPTGPPSTRPHLSRFPSHPPLNGIPLNNPHLCDPIGFFEDALTTGYLCPFPAAPPFRYSLSL